MLNFDASQLAALALDHQSHARVLGAPGSGKSSLIAEVYSRMVAVHGWTETDLLVWAPTRVQGARLRARIEGRCSQALSGTLVRTPASYGFAVVQRQAALRARNAPKLLTGTAHDLAISEVLAEQLAAGNLAQLVDRFSPEVILGDVFRSELRDLSRVLDDYAVSQAELSSRFAQQPDIEAFPGLSPTREQRDMWHSAVGLCARIQDELTRTKSEEWSSSRILASAAEAVRADTEIPVPKLVLVDDAQELGEGALALLAALASRGASVWVWGDPDVATAAFQGERTSVLADLHGELRRRGLDAMGNEQTATLGVVHRQGSVLRGFAQQLATRIGTAGAGSQRAAVSALPPNDQTEGFTGLQNDPGVPEASALTDDGRIEFAVTHSATEQIGAVAHRLRRRHLGLDGMKPQPWSKMAVICRTRAEVSRAARVLAAQQVPTNIAAGGIVLRDHQLVRELISLTQYACGMRTFHTRDIWDLLSGVVGGLDPIAIRRFRAEIRLREQRTSRAEQREALSVDALALAAFFEPGETPIIDARSGRQLRKLGVLVARAQQIHADGGTPREVLWQIWDGTGLAEHLQTVALDQAGTAADEAHHTLDAVMGLFFALQRHEENDSSQPIEELLSDLMSSALAEDTLAARSQLECVTVTTAQGAAGMQFETVCILGPQDGVWPNLRARGSLLQVTAFERWLRGQHPAQPSRRDTLHDELRLFLQGCSRASSELLVVAIADEDHHPSPFFGFGRQYLRATALPSNRLTVRGAVSHMRQRVVVDTNDSIAAHSLAALARLQVPGAHPQEWYGVKNISTSAPLVDLSGDPDVRVSVSPSRMEAAERCPLDWVISQLGGAPAGAVQQLGTLLHYAFERGEELNTVEAIFDAVSAQWHQLDFEAEWQSQRYLETAREMAVGIADYLAEFALSSRELLGTEVPLSFQIGRALVRGTADRLEAVTRADGQTELSVVDLKTGSSFPSANDILSHAQLQAYQLGITEGGYQLADGSEDTEAVTGVNGGARLLYVDPSVRTSRGADAGSTFRVAAQPQLTDEARTAFIERIAAAAEVMAAGTFTARVEHHCSDPYAHGGSCALHIIPSVSQA